jgi:hypothetical protein
VNVDFEKFNPHYAIDFMPRTTSATKYEASIANETFYFAKNVFLNKVYCVMWV